MPPRSSRIPALSNCTVCTFSSRRTFRQPTSLRAAANFSGSGIFRVRLALRHNCTTGPTVTSKAPSEIRDVSSALDSTKNSSSLTFTGSPPDFAHRRINSLVGW